MNMTFCFFVLYMKTFLKPLEKAESAVIPNEHHISWNVESADTVIFQMISTDGLDLQHASKSPSL